MDRQLLLAIALSALVVIGYQEYLRIYYPPRPKPASSEATPSPAPEGTRPAAPVAPAGPVTPAPEPAATAPAPEADLSVDTPLFHARISSLGGRLVSLTLKHYRTSVDPGSPPLELVHVAPGGELPLGVTLRGSGEPWSDRQLAYRASQREIGLDEGESAALVLAATSPEGGSVEKRLSFDAGRYSFEVDVRVANAPGRFAEASLGWTHRAEPPAGSYAFHGVEALVGGKLHQIADDKLAGGIVLPEPNPTAEVPAVHWAGYADSYFISSISPRLNDPARMWAKLDRGQIATEILVPAAATSAEPYPFTVYTGPKDLHTLAAADHHLTRAVNLGWFSFVAEPMLRLLKFFHGLSGNYGVDIILLTLLVKVALMPLTNKTYKSMREMQKLQPQMKKLQEKHANDREALNKELMELYRRHKVNPFGGCLPMILQMPIFIGLYNALLSAVELRHAPFALWINDLSAPDRLPPVTHAPLANVGGFEVRIPVLTLFMGATMLVQQKMTPPVGDPAQQRMMMFMPLIFTAMFINFPSGLVLYWLVNNVLTIAQQAYMQRNQS